MTLEAQPSNTDLNKICYRGVSGELDVPAALDALATVVDDLVYLGCWEELQVGHNLLRQLRIAHRYDASAKRDVWLKRADLEFNRLKYEDFRSLLVRLATSFADTDTDSNVRRLGDYLLNRKTSGEARRRGDIAAARYFGEAAAQQLRCLTDAPTHQEEEEEEEEAAPFNIEGAEDYLANWNQGCVENYGTRQHIPGFIAWGWGLKEEILEDLDRRNYENIAFELAYNAKQDPVLRDESYAVLEAAFVGYLETHRDELIEALEDVTGSR